MKPQDIQTKRLGLSNESLVYDKSKWRETELRRSFIGSVNQAGVANEYAHAQLWNPVDSGITAIVNWEHIGNQNTWFVSNFYNQALTTLDSNGFCKHSLGAASICQIRRESNVAILATNWLLAPSVYTTASKRFTMPLSDLFILTSGWGLNVVMATKQMFNFHFFEWLEYPEELVGLG